MTPKLSLTIDLGSILGNFSTSLPPKAIVLVVVLPNQQDSDTASFISNTCIISESSIMIVS
jgi:hypothetical protein